MHLEVGQPGTPAPRAVIEAARRALTNHRLGYTESLGIPELRERIARHYRETYGVAVSPERVVALEIVDTISHETLRQTLKKMA